MSSGAAGIPRFARSDGVAGWQQRSWDWRAAANFICGGAGAGLVISSVVAAPAMPVKSVLLVAATLAIAFGLLCVWFEIGQPKRALNVFLNPFSSWMTREALFATALVPCALAAAAGVPAIGWLAAALAFAFLFSQAYILRAAKAIPAWRDARTPALTILTGLAEGAGVFVAIDAWTHAPSSAAWLAFGVLVAARAAWWDHWRQGLQGRLAPRAAAALNRAGRGLVVAGTAAPLVALTLALSVPPGAATWLMCLGGLLAAAAGIVFKATLIGTASYNQGFTLARAPVRGTRR